jgi:hypothetical protein
MRYLTKQEKLRRLFKDNDFQKINCRKIFKKFLWLPKIIDGEIRWLERTYVSVPLVYGGRWSQYHWDWSQAEWKEPEELV